MGTNYYAHIIPSHERKKRLHDAIETNNFTLISRLTQEMYGSMEKEWDSDEIIGGIVHLGKASGGWKFLWNPNVFVVRHGHMEDVNGARVYISEPDTALYLYPLTKEGIKAFIDREDVEIYDEYGEKQDKEEFWKDALDWTTWQGEEAWDAKSYDEWEKKQNPNYHHYVCTGEYINLLIKEGFQMNSYTNSDFYSDGLRFASSNEFS